MSAAGAVSGERDAAWRDLDRRSARLWLLLSACLPVLLVAYVLDLLLAQRWLYPVVALGWLAAVGWAGYRMASFACPQCRGPFFENWYFFKPLRRKCSQCSLARGAPSPAP